jgi:hypothetical protein
VHSWLHEKRQCLFAIMKPVQLRFGTKCLRGAVVAFAFGCAAVAHAAAIASGEIKTGTLKFGAKETWTIQLEAGERMLVGLGATSATNTRLSVGAIIYEPFGLPVGLLPNADTAGAGFGGRLTAQNAAPYTGTYSITVECFRSTSLGLTPDDTVTYRLEVLRPKSGVFSIPNGDDGGALTNGLSSDGTIVSGDFDVWTFTASAGERYLIDLTLIPEADGSPASQLRPLTANLSTSVYHPDGNYFEAGRGIVQTARIAGSHAVVVTNGFLLFYGPQRYRLRKISVPSLFSVSPGEQGGPLTNSQTHAGTIGYYNVDCWTMPASAGDSITIRVNKTSGPLFTPRLTILAPPDARQSYTGTGEQSFIFRPTTNGIHTFVVDSAVPVSSAGVDSGSGSYTLFVSGATPPAPPAPPTIAVQPATQTVTTGATISLSVGASGAAPLSYQWRRDATTITGATTATLTIPNAQDVNEGAYTVVVSNGSGSVTSDVATVTVAPAIASRISNVSVRTTLAANQTLIVGMSMAGGSKSVLLRAVGPGLAQFGVGGTMPDPRLALFNGATQEIANDNWSDGGGGRAGAVAAAALSAAFTAVGAFALPAASLDAALLRDVDGARTAQVIGTTGGGVLVEAYDAGTGNAPRLVNISARNRVGTGGDILIAGFVIAGTGSKTVLIRAVGPTLGVFGVPGTLADPKLEIYSGTTKINENDTWAASLAPTFTAVGAFQLITGSRDAALLATLPAGSYTVQVSGADGGAGEALVEIYEAATEAELRPGRR